MRSAKREGNQFEQLFERAALRQGLGIIRIADGCRRVGLKKLIPVKQAADWILAFNNKAALIDTKSMGKGKTFSHAYINDNQIRPMAGFAIQGVIAGYVVWFREHNKIVFYKVELLSNVLPGNSLSIDDGELLGSLEECDLRRIFHGST